MSSDLALCDFIAFFPILYHGSPTSLFALSSLCCCCPKLFLLLSCPFPSLIYFCPFWRRGRRERLLFRCLSSNLLLTFCMHVMVPGRMLRSHLRWFPCPYFLCCMLEFLSIDGRSISPVYLSVPDNLSCWQSPNTNLFAEFSCFQLRTKIDNSSINSYFTTRMVVVDVSQGQKIGLKF